MQKASIQTRIQELEIPICFCFVCLFFFLAGEGVWRCLEGKPGGGALVGEDEHGHQEERPDDGSDNTG